MKILPLMCESHIVVDVVDRLFLSFLCYEMSSKSFTSLFHSVVILKYLL